MNFLYDSMEKLATAYNEGRKVETNNNLRFIAMKRSTQGRGHIAVYRITNTAVRIVHVFHDAQDWENKVKPKEK